MALGDFLLLLLSLKLAILLRGTGSHPGLMTAAAPLFALFLGVFALDGLYDLRQIRDFTALVAALLRSGAACLAVGVAYFYALGTLVSQSPKTFLLAAVVLSHVGMLAWRRAVLALTRFDLLKLRLLVLADDAHLEHLRRAIGERWQEEMRLAAAVDAGVDLLVIDSAWMKARWPQARLAIASAAQNGVPVVSLDAFYEALFGKISPHAAADPDWALEHVLPRVNGRYFAVRRAVEAAASALGLLALAPVLAAAAAAVALIDRMPPIYGQPRVGRMGKVFTLWKLRTMPPGADAAQAFAPGAARPTRLGAFLRRFRLDEFPQLWNVLRGDMSLVGPRPEWVKEVAVIEKAVPNYHLRHLVPPGITGWAQVYYRATQGLEGSLEKHHYDLYYLKRFSPALDLAILLKTLKRVLVSDARVQSVRVPFPAERRPLTEMDMSAIVGRS